MHKCPGDCALYQLHDGEEDLEELAGCEYSGRIAIEVDEELKKECGIGESELKGLCTIPAAWERGRRGRSRIDDGRLWIIGCVKGIGGQRKHEVKSKKEKKKKKRKG
jgi:hypothetical protein